MTSSYAKHNQVPDLSNDLQYMTNFTKNLTVWNCTAQNDMVAAKPGQN